MTRIFLIALALALTLPFSAAATEQRPTLTELESELMCPTCDTTLDQSHAPVAERMRGFITRRIGAGDTKSEIKDQLVDEFGTGVLAAPPKQGFDLLAWLLPLAGLLVGAGVTALLAWRWSRGRETALVSGAAGLNGRGRLEPELERRVDAELARLE
jgi:cytochrome c-type biogenesis protein CcmH